MRDPARTKKGFHQFDESLSKKYITLLDYFTINQYLVHITYSISAFVESGLLISG
jgi:hypothetical protein